VDRPLKRIREFRNRPNPAIAVTVDLLSTGVDIPDLEFIVFLRPVKSRILFEQMLGRGTRKGERFPDKSHFTVFDCFDGTLLDYFKKTTGITAEAPERSARTIAEVIEDIWSNRDRDYNIACLVKRLHRVEKEMSGEGRKLFAAYVPEGDLAGYARRLPAALRANFVGAMKLLRDESFQDLLVTYPRPKRVFLVAPGVEDQVSSAWTIRGLDGKEYKPGDYLDAFAAFVRENPAKIEAIRILLSRPKAWSSEALVELRQKLSQSKQRFTVENLQKAHEVQYHRALVDIISMVKHAADQKQPLLTAGERVDRAIQALSKGVKFTPDQQRWLDRIRAHLVENLSIERADFDEVPVFARDGGWKGAQRVFGARLEPLLRDLNELVAA
jgi:type I restriction enzyme R subunit